LRANSKEVLVSGLDIIVDCFATLKQTKVQILSELKHPELRVIKRNKGLRGWFQFKILEGGVL
jgi:tRNA A37 threonylcarbamoyladenosine dehydratase